MELRRKNKEVEFLSLSLNLDGFEEDREEEGG
jgi:hypothetical protein